MLGFNSVRTWPLITRPLFLSVPKSRAERRDCPSRCIRLSRRVSRSLQQIPQPPSPCEDPATVVRMAHAAAHARGQCSLRSLKTCWAGNLYFCVEMFENLLAGILYISSRVAYLISTLIFQRGSKGSLDWPL